MPRIHSLPPTLISQIAAGEVVERPASVVKELVENALDAGATRIEVALAGGGLERIVIVDNGCGMAREDAELAVERHTTSKLRSADDLFALRTLGFRGEALASIASVSDFELLTRSEESEIGAQVHVKGGAPAEVREAAALVGTRMSVADLFFNQPARQKFQKSKAAEQSQCVQSVLRVALAHPQVRFIVRNERQLLLDLPQVAPDDFEAGRARIARALGIQEARHLYPFELSEGSVTLHGFAADPEHQCTDSRNIYAYVNGRFVRDRLLQRAVAEGYRSLLPHGRYPTTVLWLQIDPQEVDVNVHPQKLEVRFVNGSRLFSLVARAIALVLAQTPWLENGGAQLAPMPSSLSHEVAQEAPYDTASTAAPAASYRPSYEREERMAWSKLQAALPYLAPGRLQSGGLPSQPWPSNPQAAALPPDFAAQAAERTLHSAELTAQSAALTTQDAALTAPTSEASSAPLTAPLPLTPPRGFFSQLTLLGQFAQLYLLCEGEGQELVIVDQHAAHERIMFEKLMTAWEAQQQIPSQRLLVPLTLAVKPGVIDMIAEQLAPLSALGIELAPFGAQTLALTALPAALPSHRALDLVQAVIEELESAERVVMNDFAQALIARMACHAAVRAGDTLTPFEQRALLQAMDSVDCNIRCPHGRPVVARIGVGAVGRWFER